MLLDTVKGLPPYLFIMLGLYSGLRREEILALQWDCVFLDEDTPYLSVRRAWRTEHNRPVISTVLKTPAAKRDIPIPKCLVDCLRETKENSISDYVIADSKGEPLAASQFQRVWQYVVARSTKPRNYYKYVNGQSIKYTVTPTLGMTQKNQPKIRYTLDFDVTPHQLRHTYITNLLYAGVDPKNVMKCIKTTDAVGHVLCHDITRIVKDVVKDTAFRKGHIVQEEDIPVLLSLGKDHLYVWEKDENTLHENEAAQILCDVCINENMHPTDVKEGKIELIADCDGVFQVDVPRLDAINEIDEKML